MREIVISGIILLIIDFIYLSIMKNQFMELIEKIQGYKANIEIYAVILCYIFIIIGLNYFIIRRRENIINAFLLGLIIYGVYETTNLALFKKWNLKLAIIDIIWGGILFALTTYITYLMI